MRSPTNSMLDYSATRWVIYLSPLWHISVKDKTVFIFSIHVYFSLSGSGIVGPCLTSIAVSQVPRANENGVAMGIFRSLGALARSCGPLLAASLFWCFGARVAYVFGAVCFIFPLFLLRDALIKQNTAKRLESKSRTD